MEASKQRLKAKCPIVPVALIDSFKPFDTKTISQVDVLGTFLKTDAVRRI